ncbi:MAG: hypothetical protein KGZ65_04395 [Sphingomonadales bacterium]|nr:hypothetical protein [Sphingomonadaceae bacterium]MBS3930454.1 hypothetical protein [Sphingomonadales bacterium]
MKFIQLMTCKIGDKSVTYTGRQPFRIDNDAAFEAALLAIGVFERLEDGTMRYSGGVTVPLKDGGEAKVDVDGNIQHGKADLLAYDKGSFI